MLTLRRWNIAIGNFFFRYRNALFPVIFLLVAFTMRPKIMLGSPTLDRLLVASGAAVALLGELFRLMTIGYEYIHRGGKDKQIYANRLVQGGMYSVTRNPMYVGNALIAIGMTMQSGSPPAYLLVIPFFLFIYQAMVSAEEQYLQKRFGSQFEDYCARVDRFVPRLRDIRSSLSDMRCDWKRAFRKDLSTLMGLIIGFLFLRVWRTYFLEDFAAAKMAALRALALALGGTLVYGVLHYLKKQRRWVY